MPNPADYVDEGYTYVKGYVRKKRRKTGLNIPTFGFLLLFIILIGLAIWIIKTFWVIIALISFIALSIFVVLKWKKWRLISICLGIIGLGVCLSIFFLEKEPSSTVVNAIQVDKFTGSEALGGYEAIILIEPTLKTKVDQLYLLHLDNSITTLEYQVSWNQLEINIHKIKTLVNVVSQDEKTAWNMHPSYKLSVYEMIPRHNLLNIFLGLIIFAVFLFLAIYVFPRVFKEY